MSLLMDQESKRSNRRKRLEPPPEQINIDADRHFEMIDKKLLVVPVDQYQRDESGGVIARDIAAHFDWAAFGALTVILTNDVHYVVDGGTRLAGANMRPDITEIPCITFEGLSHEEAAKTFLRINMNRRKLRTEQQQKSEFYAGEELAIQADLAIRRFAEHRVTFDALTQLRSGLKMAAKATHTIVEIVPKFATDKHLTARVFKGLIWLETELDKADQTLNRRFIIRKLQSEFGLLDPYIAGAIPARTTGDKKICGTAIARKLRIRIPQKSKKI